MYAVYNYAAGSTAANVTSDIIKILTGETNKANLSANCVQANTDIISTVPAGWTVWDAAASASHQVIRALNQDGTTYKYYKFGCTSTTIVEGVISEGWNATTHTPTNAMANTAAIQSSWNAASGGYFYIYASQKNISIQSFHTSAYQTVTGMSVFEFSRDTVPTGYPAFCQTYSGTSVFQFGQSGSVQLPRYKNATTTGDTLASAQSSPIASIMAVGATFESQSNPSFFRDASEAVTFVAYKLSIGGTTSYTTTGGNRQFGEVYDLYWCGNNSGSPRDEITFGGKTYVLHGSGSSYGFLLVPKE